MEEDVCLMQIMSDCVVPLAAKCVDQFILHASLVRPLGMAGQLRLASDCAQLELALEPVVGKIDSDVIGHSYSVSRFTQSAQYQKILHLT